MAGAFHPRLDEGVKNSKRCSLEYPIAIFLFRGDWLDKFAKTLKKFTTCCGQLQTKLQGIS